MGPGYLHPSDYELVNETSAIVLAEAVSFDGSSMFTFRVLEVLKGDFPDATLEQKGFDRYLGGSDESDFGGVRPGALTGGCNPYSSATRVGRPTGARD